MKIKKEELSRMIMEQLFDVIYERSKNDSVETVDANDEETSSDQEELDSEDSSEDDEAIDTSGESGKNPSGAVNNDVSGKTIQAITIEPKSKILPGAKEIIISFGETTDPLRILATPTGAVKFYWRGGLHDLP